MSENNNIPEWLKRVVEEHKEICGRCKRLKAFIDSHSAPEDISCAAHILLKQQLKVMGEYRDVLYLRICLGNAEPSLVEDKDNRKETQNA